jgi:trehalose 2-sulfotransferase
VPETFSPKNLLEMSRNRDFPGNAPVRVRYGILSSQRSGSTLLARMLFETGQAGDPLEYFNLRLLAIARKQTGNQFLTPIEFKRLMEMRRTSPNGVFGMKIQYEQMLRAFQSNGPNEKITEFLRSHQHLFWVRRRDRLRQAISLALAMHTNSWSSEEPPKVPPGSIHLLDCIHALQVISFEDFGWAKLISTAKLNVRVIWYEDLIADYEGTCRPLLRDLNLEIPKIPPPPIKRQSTRVNDQLHIDLVQYLGLSDDRTGLSSRTEQAQ